MYMSPIGCPKTIQDRIRRDVYTETPLTVAHVAYWQAALSPLELDSIRST